MGFQEFRVWEEMGEHRFMGFWEFGLGVWEFGSLGHGRSWDNLDLWDFRNLGHGRRWVSTGLWDLGNLAGFMGFWEFEG